MQAEDNDDCFLAGEACRPWQCCGGQSRCHYGSAPQGRGQTECRRRQMLVPIVPRAVPRELGPRAWVGGLRVVGRRVNGRINDWVEVERLNGECVGGE